MTFNYTGSDSWIENVRLRSQTDQVLGGLNQPANVGTQDVADRTVYLKAQIIRDIQEQVEIASGGKATVRQDAGGIIDYFAKIAAFRPVDIGTDLGSNNLLHPAFYVNDTSKDYFLMSILPGVKETVSSTDYLAPSVGQIPATDTVANLRTQCTNKGTGYHLMTFYEYAAACLLGLYQARIYNHVGSGTFRDYLAGNTDSGVFDAGERQYGQLLDPLIPDQTLPGSGPLQWRHDGSPWGVADLIGNFKEVVDLIKTVNGQIHLPISGTSKRDNYYSQVEASWTATGIYYNISAGALILDTTTTIPTSSFSDVFQDIVLSAGLLAAGNSLVDSSFIVDTLISPQWNDSGATNPALVANARGLQTIELATATHYYQVGGQYDDQSDAGCGAKEWFVNSGSSRSRCCLIE